MKNGVEFHQQVGSSVYFLCADVSKERENDVVPFKIISVSVEKSNTYDTLELAMSNLTIGEHQVLNSLDEMSAKNLIANRSSRARGNHYFKCNGNEYMVYIGASIYDTPIATVSHNGKIKYVLNPNAELYFLKINREEKE